MLFSVNIPVLDSDAAEGEHLDSLPPYKTGCSANMLGLCGVTPEHLLNLLKASICFSA